MIALPPGDVNANAANEFDIPGSADEEWESGGDESLLPEESDYSRDLSGLTLSRLFRNVLWLDSIEMSSSLSVDGAV